MSRTILTTLILGAGVLISPTAQATSDSAYASLQGIESTAGVFEVREAQPKKLLLYLRIIQMVSNDSDLLATTGRPKLAIVFSGQAVSHLSVSRVITEDNQQFYRDLDEAIRELIADGATVEFCRGAARVLGLIPESAVEVSAEINNAWVSVMGYQRQGYAYIPGF